MDVFIEVKVGPRKAWLELLSPYLSSPRFPDDKEYSKEQTYLRLRIYLLPALPTVNSTTGHFYRYCNANNSEKKISIF